MSDFLKNGDSRNERERALQQENAELRQKLREAETERDLYLKMVHTWARLSFTEQEIEQWEKNDDPGDGRTLMDIIAEVKSESPGI